MASGQKPQATVNLHERKPAVSDCRFFEPVHVLGWNPRSADTGPTSFAPSQEIVREHERISVVHEGELLVLERLVEFGQFVLRP